MMRQINLRVSEELLARVDEVRGDVPRERWLRGVVELVLGGASSSASAESRAGLELSRAEAFRRATGSV